MKKYLVIPLERGRYIKLLFSQTNTGKWVCECCNETFTDIENFSKTGFYKLDPSKQLEIQIKN